MKSKSKSPDWEERYKRALADLTRAESLRADEVERSTFRAKIGIIKEFLPLIDDIERALAKDKRPKTKGAGGEKKTVLLMLRDKAQQSLKLLGVEKLELKRGTKPDLLTCEVVGIVEGEEDGTVAEITEAGYRIGNLIVRPSRVIVSRRSLAK